MYLERTAGKLDALMAKTGQLSLVHECLCAYFKEAWREKVRRDLDGGTESNYYAYMCPEL